MVVSTYIVDPVDKKKKPEIVGLICPSCSGGAIIATNSRPGVIDGRGTMARTRKCTDCGLLWKTYEVTMDHFVRGSREVTKRVVAELLDKEFNK